MEHNISQSRLARCHRCIHALHDQAGAECSQHIHHLSCQAARGVRRQPRRLHDSEHLVATVASPNNWADRRHRAVELPRRVPLALLPLPQATSSGDLILRGQDRDDVIDIALGIPHKAKALSMSAGSRQQLHANGRPAARIPLTVQYFRVPAWRIDN